MIKKFLSISILIIILIVNLSSTISYAETITLEQIVTKFNNSSLIKDYEEQGYNLSASTSENKLTISIITNEMNENFEYILNESILTTTLSGENSFTGIFITLNLVDIIGQLHGYEEGEIYDTLNSDEITNYTIENQGFEAKQLEDGSYQIKIDINKKIPIADFSDVYFEVSDLEDLEDYIKNSGSAQQKKGNVVFHKSGDNDVILFVGEKDELTKNAYKSILSILQVMFDDEKVVQFFEKNYSDISIGNKDFTGFKIEANPEKSDMEKVVLGEDNTYKFVRITIDKNLVKNTVKGNNNQNEEDNGNDNNVIINEVNDNSSKEKNEVNNGKVTTKEEKELPESGLNRRIIPIIIVAGMGLIIFFIKLYKLKDVK